MMVSLHNKGISICLATFLLLDWDSGYSITYIVKIHQAVHG